MESAVFTPKSWTEHLPLDAMFPRAQPLEVDVGCGKGRFLAARAEEYPERNFLGIDRLLRRIRKANKKLVRKSLKNARLLRIEAFYAVEHLLPQNSVQTFFIFFPDPWPKKRHHRRRLLKPPFVDALFETLRKDGEVHLATDYPAYYEEARDLLENDVRFAAIPTFVPKEEERTEFEMKFAASGLTIHRCSFRKQPTARPTSEDRPQHTP